MAWQGEFLFYFLNSDWERASSSEDIKPQNLEHRVTVSPFAAWAWQMHFSGGVGGGEGEFINYDWEREYPSLRTSNLKT